MRRLLPMKMENNAKILVFGANGQVGKALSRLLSRDQVILVDRLQADLAQDGNCLSVLNHHRPQAVINAAAYTQVDLAEKEMELARKINADAPSEIASWCAQNRIPFVHLSTDYVFSGVGDTPWKESDPITPLNVYGKTKAEGEEKVSIIGGKFLIFRTSWVYDSQGKNFLRTMLKLGHERESLRIVQDQFGAPTFATEIAKGILKALESSVRMSQFPSGIYHLCNSGVTNWFHFAEMIFEIARSQGLLLKIKTVEPILSDEFPTPAPRPKNSRLNTQKIHDTFGIRLPEWSESLRICLQEIK